MTRLPGAAPVSIKFTQNAFKGHDSKDVDVSVMNVGASLDKLIATGTPAFAKGIDFPTYVPNAFELSDVISPIQEVLVIGYPNGLWDPATLTPIARRGITATPCTLPFRGGPKFLIDSSIFGGSSGSPVFAYSSGNQTGRDGKVYVGPWARLLGIVSGVMFLQEHGEVVEREIPTTTKQLAAQTQYLDLGVVFNHHTIKECMDSYLAAAGVLDGD